MLDNKRRIPLGYSKDQENRLVEAYNSRGKKPNYGEKKSYSISYEVPKDDGAQNSPHFLNAITSSRTDREVTELQTSLRETRAELERKAAKVENEIAMRREMRKMKEFMQHEQQRKLKELEESVNEYWGAKISKLHRDYQVQIDELEKSGEQGRISPPKKDKQRSISELAKKIEEKHYREYVHKVDEIKENFKKIDEENRMEIKREIVRELEPIYKEQVSQKGQYTSPSETNHQDFERETRPKERGNRLKLRTQASLERSLVNKSRVNGNQSEAVMAKDAEKIEEALRKEYQEDLSYIKKAYEDNEKEMWKVLSKAEMRTRDKKRREIEEKLNRELSMKEKEMELKYRQRMEKQQEALKKSFELEVENQLKEEKKSLIEEKGEIGRLKSRANIKAHKVQEAKQAFYEKLKQQEEKFAKKVDTLQRELDGLKQGHDDRSNSPTLGQLRAEYLRKAQDQGEAALTTTKWQKSLRNQGKENKSRSPGASKSFISLKPPLSDSINERARSNQMRRKSYAAEEPKTGGYSSQSTSRMETSKEYQNPKYYLQKSMRGEGGQDSSPFNRSFNSKLSNIAVVAKKDDSNRTMKAVLDASQPPELLFSSKGDTVPLLPYRPKEERYRKQSGDTRDNITDTLPSYDVSTRRRSLIKNESSVEYGKLKAEIMSKYEPGYNRLKSGDMSFMDGMGRSRQESEFGKKTPDNALEKAKLAEQRKKEFMEKYDRSLKKLEFERSSAKKKERQYTDTGASLDNSRALTTNPEEKYREIMDKYLDKSVSQKYAVTEKMKRSSGYEGVSGKYQELFRINEDDTAQNKSMKRFKKVIEDAIEKDNALEAKYLAREVFFTTDFIASLDSENKYLKETLKGKFRNLFEGWDVTETSYEARLSFLAELDLMLRLEDVTRKVDAETEYLSQYSYEIGEIIGLMKERNKLKGKVNVKKFEYSLYKGIYGMIDEVMGKMKVFLQDYHRLRKREIIYKGIDLSDIIKVDMWEHTYLNEVEEREVLWERVKHRH